MALPLIENIADKSATVLKQLITENAEQIRKDITYIAENTDDGKKCTLRLSHSIVIDLDSSEQKDVLSWSLSRKHEASSALTDKTDGSKIGTDSTDDDTIA